jgi:CheY-like chemotaxis protein
MTSTGRFVRPDGVAAGRNAVVADDDAEMRSLMSTVLRSAGFDVVEAVDGNELLEVLRRSLDAPPALVVTDVQMPGFTGTRVLQHMRRLGLKTPVIVVTAFGGPRLHAEALRLGAAAVLDKPFSVVTLRELALSFGKDDLLSA